MSTTDYARLGSHSHSSKCEALTVKNHSIVEQAPRRNEDPMYEDINISTEYRASTQAWLTQEDLATVQACLYQIKKIEQGVWRRANGDVPHHRASLERHLAFVTHRHLPGDIDAALPDASHQPAAQPEWRTDGLLIWMSQTWHVETGSGRDQQPMFVTGTTPCSAHPGGSTLCPFPCTRAGRTRRAHSKATACGCPQCRWSILDPGT